MCHRNCDTDAKISDRRKEKMPHPTPPGTNLISGLSVITATDTNHLALRASDRVSSLPCTAHLMVMAMAMDHEMGLQSSLT